MPHGVLVGDLVHLLIRERGELQLVDLGPHGPRAVRVRKVRLPTDVVNVELVNKSDADGIIDETAENPLLEHIGGPHALWELLSGPAGMALLDVLSPLQEVRDPTDVTLSEREDEVGKSPPEIRPQQITQRIDGHDGGEAHANGGWCIGRRRGGFGRGPDMQTEDVPASEHAAKRGSQWPEWIDGI